MKIIWEIKEGVIHDILHKIEEPKPAYNTISTIVRILETKGFISHKAVGRTHIYYPLIGQEEYTNRFFKNFLSKYFHGSFAELASSFTRWEDFSIGEMEEIQKLIAENIKKKGEKS